MITQLVPSHAFAIWLLKGVDHLLDMLGLDRDPRLEDFFYIIIIVTLAFTLGWALRVAILYLARKMLTLRRTELGEMMLRQHILQRCSHVIPPMVLLGLLPFAFESESGWIKLLDKCIVVYLIYTIVRAINSVLSFIWIGFDKKENARNLPLKGILNTAQGIVWIIATIIAVSILVNKSPAALLTGLGAFAAALMLIFKDSILGFVAGIQLSQNDMLHVGDWIVVPSTIANGIVIDVSLSTVKVRNWDNTIVTLPPYTLISSSFQNWRGMTESGVRQIVRAITVVTTSVVPIDETFIDNAVRQLPALKPFIDKMRASGGKMTPDPGKTVVNGTVDTNLGLLRAYLCEYLIANDGISKDYQILVRTMTPTQNGIPLQLWCYTSTPAWTAYEAIQSAIFEHIAVVAPVLGLRLYNAMSDNDPDVIQIAGPLPTVTVRRTDGGEVGATATQSSPQ